MFVLPACNGVPLVPGCEAGAARWSPSRDGASCFLLRMSDKQRPLEPTEPERFGRVPTDEEPDPAPEAERPSARDLPSERGATVEPAGRDNIREGKVKGLMGGPHPSQGQGQGG